MKCSKCGKDINKDDKFCAECGQVVNFIVKENPKDDKKKDEVKNEESNMKDETTKEVNTEVEEKRIVSGMKNDTFFCVLSIICYVVGPILFRVFGMLSDRSSIFGVISKIFALFPLAAYALAIYAKVKYPKSTFAKILLIVYLVMFVFAVIALIIIFVSCYLLFKNCQEAMP